MVVKWCHCYVKMASSCNVPFSVFSGLEVVKLEFILKLKIKRNDWLLAGTCPQAANHCVLEAEPGKLDIKSREHDILFISLPS